MPIFASQVSKEKTPMMNIRPASSRRGFTLIELAIVLAIAGVLFVGLWRLLAGGNQQIKDTTAATQQEQLIAAVKTFLSSPEGQQYMTSNPSCGGNCAPNISFRLALPTVAAGSAGCPASVQNMDASDPNLPQQKSWCNALPPGFLDANKNAYGQTYMIGIKRDGTDAGKVPHTYSFMIATTGGDTIPDSSGGRISAQIGADGGFRYTNPVCGNPVDATLACGAFGAWTANPLDYKLTVSGGHIASRTFSSPEDSSSMPWLARYRWPEGDTTYQFNTMTTDLFMGVSGSATPTNINMAPNSVTTGGGDINMHGGKIDLATGSLVSYQVPVPSSIILKPNAIFSGNLVDIDMNCTRQQNVNATPPINYDGNCGVAMQVRGDVLASVINVSQAFAQVFFYQSDRRLKNSIEPIKGALDTMMKIEPVSFKFNGSKIDSMGVIAQDIEKIYPNIVTENGKDGMKSVAYHELIAPMIAAIQELKRDNDSLREQLKAQQDRQDKIEKEMTGNRK